MHFECPLPISSYDRITLGHGGGGKLTQRLITQLLQPLLQNPFLDRLHDGAVIPFRNGSLAMTTDSFVVHPLFFPGGDIGTLSVHGTVNDLAMCGARPLYLSLALIIEEGFPVEDLYRVVTSIREACIRGEVQVITGDMKVVEKGKGDGIFINTTGIGEVVPGIDISPERIRPGDQILISGPIAEHGIAILSVREGLSFETELKSDTAGLWPVVKRILEAGGENIHALRDATRGGVASVLNEMAQGSRTGMTIEETRIPVREDVRGACEILGLDPLYVANEGKFVAFVAKEDANRILNLLHDHPLGQEASIIGEVLEAHPGIVRMKSAFGGSRVVEMISGEQLPRIC